VEIDLIEEIYKLVRQVPRGRVSTYGAVARALGDIIASRAVGFALNLNPDPDRTPCYRIIASDGSIGGFSRGIEEKIERLRRDGIEVRNGKVMNFGKVFFDDFDTDYPLKRLRKEQMRLSRKVRLKDELGEIRYVAGFDAGYSKSDPLTAHGAIVTIELESMEIVEEMIARKRIRFPYIPTYLAFREFPVFLEAYRRIKIQPDLILVDGNGILHPFKLGIASHIGVSLDLPTIGVAKNLLMGEMRGEDVVYQGEVLGKAVYSSRKPIFVSPGHRMSLDTAVRLVRKLCRYRIPEPVRLAHILAKS